MEKNGSARQDEGTFAAYERDVTLRHLRVGALLVAALMPAGVSLDYAVYRQHVLYFLILRLVCTVVEVGIWFLLFTRLTRRFPYATGLVIALLPVFFICWMITVTEGAASPYYAGLNLILLAIALVLRWSFGLSVGALALTTAMYLMACFLHGWEAEDKSLLFNNLYFIALTGVIVVTGSRIHRQLREKEFALTTELKHSNEKLMELDQIKNRFFANISHELRTPLTLLLAPLETLLHRFGSSLDPNARSMLLTMHSNGMRLLKLINDLLDLVRLESGRLQIRKEPLQLPEFLRGVARAAQQVADDKKLALEVSIAPELQWVMADRDKLEKVLLNLIFNALKFTPAGGRVELHAQKQDSELALRVSDTGVGIPAKHLPFVFDRFWQGDNSGNRKFQGVGIGLSLVKELSEAQGGKVTVQSEQGKGTTFEIVFPFEPVTPPAAQPAKTKKSDTDIFREASESGTVSSEEWLVNLYRRAELFPAISPSQNLLKPVGKERADHLPTVLIAEDEPDMLRFLSSQLAAEYQVVEAVDGQEAVEKAAQLLPELAVLDMMMPHKDGVEACREIRRNPSTHGIPVIILTARADEESKLAALEAGASDFLGKPFSTTELHVRIKNLLQSYHAQRNLSQQNQALETTIDQLKQTETQLVQTEKLASLGRMSAGIIHEINNPLNFAATGLFTLRNKSRHLAPDQQRQFEEILNDVEEGLKRVKTIVTDLRIFTRSDPGAREQVEVHEAVAAALRLASSEWKNKVRIETKVEEGQTIWANKNKIIQVVLNLLQNSFDALETKTFTEEQPTVWIEGTVDNGKSVLRVRDNGPGIETKHQDKIFEPFYTTKDVGKGMGLGLPICYRIAQEFDGRISVRTEPGKFCEVLLEFPAKG